MKEQAVWKMIVQLVRLVAYVLVVVLVLTLPTFVVAPLAYGTSIVVFVIVAIFVVLFYLQAEDSTYTRLVTGLALLGIASYIPDALGLQHAIGDEIGIINIVSLPPATMHPFVHGLRFFPAYALILAYWVVLDLYGNVGFSSKGTLGRLFLVLLVSFIGLDSWAMWTFDGLGTAVTNRIPSSQKQLLLYALILLINGLVGFLVFRKWKKASVIKDFRHVFVVCAVGALLIATMGCVINRISNHMSKCCLDQRRPQEFLVRNKNVEDCLAHEKPEFLTGGARDFLLKPEFRQALEANVFYKWNWDDSFQPPNRRAVNIGFRSAQESDFTLIRISHDLFECLRFVPVRSEERMGFDEKAKESTDLRESRH